MAVVKSLINFSQLAARSTLLYLSSTLNLWFHFPPKWINFNSVLPSHVQLELYIPVPWFSPFFSGFWWISRLLSCLTQLLDWFSVCLKDVFELRTCPRSWLCSSWYVLLGKKRKGEMPVAHSSLALVLWMTSLRLEWKTQKVLMKCLLVSVLSSACVLAGAKMRAETGCRHWKMGLWTVV